MSATLELFEVKIRKPGDRITAAGKKVEGGKVISRHFFRRSAEKAVVAAQSLRIGNVIGVKRVRRNDIIGDLVKNKEIMRLVGPRVNYNVKQVREVKKDLAAAKDVIVQDLSLSSIVYGNQGSSPEEKVRRSKRLEYNRKHDLKEETE